MVKIYTIFKGNKSGTQLIVVPKGYAGYAIGGKFVWNLVNGKLELAPAPSEEAKTAVDQAV